MKKLGIIFLLLLATFAQGQKSKVVKAPAPVRDTFRSFYPYVQKVVWTKNKEYYEAAYSFNGEKMVLVFDKTNHWTERRVYVDEYSVPASILSFIDQNFKGSKIEKGFMVYFPDKNAIYRITVQGRTFTFSGYGKIIDEETP